MLSMKHLRSLLSIVGAAMCTILLTACNPPDPPSNTGGNDGAGQSGDPEGTNSTDGVGTSGTEDPGFELTAIPGEKVTGSAIMTPSGLSYYNLVEGTGAEVIDPEPAVLVHYTGYLQSGQVFDSSVQRGQPACFLLVPSTPQRPGMIPGFVEGVRGMKVGGQRKLVIPGELGYGPSGNMQAGIGPNATLIFDIELLGIDPYAVASAPYPGDSVQGDARVTESGVRYWTIAQGAETEPVVAEDSAASITMKLYRSDGVLILDGGDTEAPVARDLIFPGVFDGMIGMTPGERRKLVVPWEHAAGLAGNPQAGIPPKTTLVADVRVVAIDPHVIAEPPYPGETAEGDPLVAADGTRYWVLAEGTGDAVLAEENVAQLSLQSWLPDGTQLASTPPGQPADFFKGPALPGLWSGIEGMKVGEKRKIIVDWEQGYGAVGQPQSGVPPKATMIFDLELLAIDPYAAPPEVLPGEPVTGDAIELPSGLKIYTVKEGTGPTPPDRSATVRLHFTFYLTDGTKIESTHDRAAPVMLNLSGPGVFPGLVEGVENMKVGEKRKLVIPPDLAFGLQGRPGQIPPKATLVFDVELLEVQPGPPADAVPPGTLPPDPGGPPQPPAGADDGTGGGE